MRTLHSQVLIRKTETSEEKITVAVERLRNAEGFHVSVKGMKMDWQQMPNASPIGGAIEANPFPTAEIAIGVAKEIVQMQIKQGFRLVEVDGEPPSSQGGFQTHVRMTPPRH